jgi:hypothetical protein
MGSIQEQNDPVVGTEGDRKNFAQRQRYRVQRR